MSQYRRDQPRAPRPLGLRGEERPSRAARGEISKELSEVPPIARPRVPAYQAAEVKDLEKVGLSVIVPARDEAAGLELLIAEIAANLRPWCGQGAPENVGRVQRPLGFEIVVIDDGSTDATPHVLGELMCSYDELRVLRFARSAGQSAAFVAGLHAARGEWVATLDADLQNDPADLPVLWDALAGGYHAALGWRKNRRDPWIRRVIGQMANVVRNAVLGQSIRDTGCSVRIMRRDIALRLPMWDGAHRFLGSLLLRQGCRIVQVPTRHRARRYGRSHYNMRNRSLHVIVDLIGAAWLARRRVRRDSIEVRGGCDEGALTGLGSLSLESSGESDFDLAWPARAAMEPS